MKTTKQTHGSALLVALLLLMTGVPLQGADNRNAGNNWDNLKRLAPGDQIQVVLNDARSYRGQFQIVSDEAIVVRLTTGDQTFTRESVLRVSTKGQSHRGRNALIGAAAGAATGIIVGVASPELGQGTCQGSCVDPAIVTGQGFLGAALGAGIGAAIPTGGWHDVYRAR